MRTGRSPWTIRRASAADDAAIAVFQTDCWREAYRGLVPQDYLDRVTVDDRQTRWRQRLTTGERQVALAEATGSVVGVVSWSESPAEVPPLELCSLYVAAGHRGTGLAGSLVETSIGDRPAHLWVFAGNTRAQHFYARLGFRPDGTTATDPDTGLTELRYVRS